MDAINVLSLFDGISCGQYALELAGIPVKNYYASEIDENCIKITQKNYPKTIQLGDVRNLNLTDFVCVPCDKDLIDLLIGGSPCQDLSIAGSRKGLDGSRSCLFWEFVRVLKTVKPKYFLFENVASMKCEDKEIITKTLGVEPILINSALVSAQTRKRLYWTNIPNVQQPENKGILLKDILESGVTPQSKSYCLTATYRNAVFSDFVKKHSRTMIVMPIRLGFLKDKSNAQANRVYSIKGKSVCLNANGGGGGAKTGLYKIDLPDGEYIIRKLTPIECERLQTLPDNYTAGVSNSSRYKAIGNGWTCEVIAHILRGLKENEG